MSNQKTELNSNNNSGKGFIVPLITIAVSFITFIISLIVFFNSENPINEIIKNFAKFCLTISVIFVLISLIIIIFYFFNNDNSNKWKFVIILFISLLLNIGSIILNSILIAEKDDSHTGSSPPPPEPDESKNPEGTWEYSPTGQTTSILTIGATRTTDYTGIIETFEYSGPDFYGVNKGYSGASGYYFYEIDFEGTTGIQLDFGKIVLPNYYLDDSIDISTDKIIDYDMDTDPPILTFTLPDEKFIRDST